MVKTRIQIGNTGIILAAVVGMITACGLIGIEEEVFIPGTVTDLTVDRWADGAVSASNSEQWFKFTATARLQEIHIKYDTATRLYVQLYDRNGNTLADPIPYIKSDIADYSFRKLTTGQVYYIQVTPYSGYSSGTYQIRFKAAPSSSQTGNADFAPDAVTPLADGRWADGAVSASNNKQWFKFTAPDPLHYLHIKYDTATSLYVQFYDRNGNTLGPAIPYRQTSDAGDYSSRKLTTGQVYYIQVTPASSYSGGAYRIAFNASADAPQ